MGVLLCGCKCGYIALLLNLFHLKSCGHAGAPPLIFLYIYIITRHRHKDQNTSYVLIYLGVHIQFCFLCVKECNNVNRENEG